MKIIAEVSTFEAKILFFYLYQSLVYSQVHCVSRSEEIKS